MTQRIIQEEAPQQEVVRQVIQSRTDRRVSILQYINTFLLTLILGVATMTASVLVGVKQEQTNTRVDIVKLQTIQAGVVSKVSELDSRVDRLEINYVEDLKTWIEQNYIRKPQSK